MELLIGADPELFVAKNGEFVSGHGMIQGTKQQPFKVDKGAVQVDGMALEFNIDPAKSEQEFLDNLDAVRKQMGAMVEGYELVNSPVAMFSEEILAMQPPEALELGCEPDFDAYTGEANPRPDAQAKFRTGAGHIHIGWTNGVDPMHPEHFEACRMLVKELDAVLYTQSVQWDGDERRSELYGKPGAFRPKPYGVEYRVLSNAWVGNECVTRYIYQVVHKAFQNLVGGEAISNNQYFKVSPSNFLKHRQREMKRGDNGTTRIVCQHGRYTSFLEFSRKYARKGEFVNKVEVFQERKPQPNPFDAVFVG